jgi:hypothetical protein
MATYLYKIIGFVLSIELHATTFATQKLKLMVRCEQ